MIKENVFNLFQFLCHMLVRSIIVINAYRYIYIIDSIFIYSIEIIKINIIRISYVLRYVFSL